MSIWRLSMEQFNKKNVTIVKMNGYLRVYYRFQNGESRLIADYSGGTQREIIKDVEYSLREELSCR